MLTVHLLPPHHHLLSGHPVAIDYLNKVEELLVLIQDGKILMVRPPDRTNDFRYVPWIKEVIEAAWEAGAANPSRTCVAPQGWLLQEELAPGMLVHDGGECYLLLFPQPFDHVEGGAKTLANAVELSTPSSRESVLCKLPMGWRHYWRPIRRDLTQEQCLRLREFNKKSDLSPEELLRILNF